MSSMNRKVDKDSECEMSFGDHLEELRKVLIHIGVTFCIVFLVLFSFFKGVILDLVFYPSQPGFITNRLLSALAQITGIEGLNINVSGVEIYNVKMAGQFMLHIKVSAVGALILCFPYIISQLWGFVKPALSKNIRRKSRRIVWEIVLWFFIGTMFCYFIVAPLAINFLVNYEANEAINNIIEIDSYIGTVFGVSFAGGLIFQLPLLVRFLASVGLITSEWMRRNRKIAIVVLLVISALITPPDVMSQCLIFLPFYLLYEYSITIAKRVEKENI